jgi:DNA polymerase alpha-associated DNA helicase A
MKQAMEKLEQMPEQAYSSFIRVLFGLSSPSVLPPDLKSDGEIGEGKIEWVNPSLNDSQKEAIRFALASREIALIHGPPGVSHCLIHILAAQP